MGKRKARKAQKPNKKVVNMKSLESEFKCPFCSAGSSNLDVEIERKGLVSSTWTATICCWKCKARYSTKATRLTDPIDLYHEWLDECQLANPPKHEP